MIESCLDYIRRGESYELCLTNAVSSRFPTSPARPSPPFFLPLFLPTFSSPSFLPSSFLPPFLSFILPYFLPSCVHSFLRFFLILSNGN